ncbi:MAG TPA: DUF4190 domain-containing protein [Blastocatellia bacterium]|nr:DUF4190 domain-containing protein [Blastocatellia bacterium]
MQTRDDDEYQNVQPSGLDSRVRKGPAVAALVVGILSFITGSFLLVGAVAGILLGLRALIKIKKEPRRYGGAGLAITGVVFSVFSIGVGVVAILTWLAIGKNTVPSKELSDTVMASVLTSLSGEENRFYSSNHRYASPEELGKENLFNSERTRFGYRLRIEFNGDSYQIRATPIHYGQPTSAIMSYFISQDGVVRGADKHGADADSSDPPYTQSPSP